jgi:hypothetical protein
MGRGEAMLKDTLFQISNSSGDTIVSYTSDGMSEPHCFARLTPGAYLVTVQPAIGMQPTSDERWSVVLDQGTTATVDFGSHITEQKAGAAAGAEGTLGLVLAALVLGGMSVWIYLRRKQA